jgi:hypothetical protein
MPQMSLNGQDLFFSIPYLWKIMFQKIDSNRYDLVVASTAGLE